MNLNNLNLNEKIEDLLAALKKKEDEKEKNTVLWVLAIIGAVAAVAGIALQYIASLLRIIWKILKKISMMILMITSRMKKSKMTACRENGNRVSVA